MKQKWKHIATIVIMSAVLVTQYQNCAPPGKLSAVAPGDGQVGVINPVTTKGAVAFSQQDVSVQPAAQSVSLNGTCREDQIGATLRWELRNGSGTELGSGYVECTTTGFQVELAPMQSLNCGEAYELVAQLGVDESEAVSITRACQ